MSVLIWVQNVCKSYQQKSKVALARNKLNTHSDIFSGVLDQELYKCACSSESWLLHAVLNTKISCAGGNVDQSRQDLCKSEDLENE